MKGETLLDAGMAEQLGGGLQTRFTPVQIRLPAPIVNHFMESN
jgi:hypothetical protein